MGAILNELNQIISKKNLVVATIANDLYNELVNATPVGNPSIWKNPNSAPKGYSGGYLKGGWELKELSNGSWIIDNPTEYAELRIAPLIIDSDGAVLQGSKQFSAGAEQIIDKYNRILESKLKAIK